MNIPIRNGNLRCLAYDLDELALFANAAHDAAMNAATPEESESSLLFLAMLCHHVQRLRDKYGQPAPIILGGSICVSS